MKATAKFENLPIAEVLPKLYKLMALVGDIERQDCMVEVQGTFKNLDGEEVEMAGTPVRVDPLTVSAFSLNALTEEGWQRLEPVDGDPIAVVKMRYPFTDWNETW